jgi:hypothetical protein
VPIGDGGDAEGRGPSLGPVTDTADRGFTLDRFQLEAIASIDAGRSVLVSAPTGSGKTVVAEHAVAVALASGGRAFYTTPIKALSNQKYHDLVRLHGVDRVGLLTGDTAVNGDAQVVVMTTEVLRNMIYSRSPALDRLEWVVLDEVHYLQDAYRGPVWEEVIVHLPAAVRLVCLSASSPCCRPWSTGGPTPRGTASTPTPATRGGAAAAAGPDDGTSRPGGSRSWRCSPLARCSRRSTSSSVAPRATTP